MIALPLPRSSAGVPRNTTSPAQASRTAASAIAAPTPDAAIVLWPQPWPRPGSASYSARMPIRGPSAPRPPVRRPRTAVSRLPTGCSTVNPWRADRVGDPGRGLPLLEGRLGVRVDAVRQVEDLVPRTLDGLGGTRLEVGERHGGSGGGGRVGHGRDRTGPAAYRSADSVSSATRKIAARNTTMAGWKASIRRSTTIAATNKPIQPPRRAARNQSPW